MSATPFAAHSPLGPGVPPHAHLRCRRLRRTGFEAGIGFDVVSLAVWRVTTGPWFWARTGSLLFAASFGNRRGLGQGSASLQTRCDVFGERLLRRRFQGSGHLLHLAGCDVQRVLAPRGCVLARPEIPDYVEGTQVVFAVILVALVADYAALILARAFQQALVVAGAMSVD